MAALVIATTGWTRADALVSILIAALILPRTLVLLRETVDVLLESTPRDWTSRRSASTSSRCRT